MDKKDKSNKQEKRIAANLSQIMSAHRRMASGSIWLAKGDVISDLFLVEAKTKMEPSKSFTIKRSWLDKIDIEAYLAGKIPALAFSFGDNVDFFILFGEHFLALTEEVLESRKLKDGFYKTFQDVINCPKGQFDPKLLDDVIATLDKKTADNSCCQVKGDGKLTLLGLINGILPELTGKVLVKNVDENDKMLGWSIVDKWW